MNISQYFTVNSSTPHPDTVNEGETLPMADAVKWAVRALRDPSAGSFERARAATELELSFEQLEG